MNQMTLAKPTFPAPDHDHGRCTADAMSHAERVCVRRAQKFTPIRRQVLQALLSSHRPLGAYEVIDELAKSIPRPAPITVYRALDFLLAHRFAHRIESRNAYVACDRGADCAGETALFLLCDKCGAAGEASSAGLHKIIAEVTAEVGFTPSAPVVEIRGLCANCL